MAVGLLALTWASWMALPSPVFACDCGYVGRIERLLPDRLVIRARVTSFGPSRRGVHDVFDSMRVEVLEAINGDSLDGDLLILGDRGMDCRVTISSDQFPVGSEHVLVLDPEESPGKSLSGCGEYWVPLREGVAVRNLGPGRRGRAVFQEEPAGVFLETLRQLGAVSGPNPDGHAPEVPEANQAGEPAPSALSPDGGNTTPSSNSETDPPTSDARPDSGSDSGANRPGLLVIMSLVGGALALGLLGRLIHRRSR